MRNHDLTFLKHFTIILLGLAVLAVFLIVIAVAVHNRQPSEPSPVAEQRTLERLRPAGAVYAGATGAAAMAEAAEAARAEAAGQVAYGGTLDGGTIYQQLCGACHTGGAGGAPTMARADWTERLPQGTEFMVRRAIDGFHGEDGFMPPRGGNPALTDDQVEASVVWMLDNLQ